MSCGSDPEGTVDAINAGRPARLERTMTAAAVQSQPKAAAEQLQLQNAVSTKLPEPAYKARPLNGIWATAPYLHNGSVRTLRQLLLPAADRQTVFQVGSREYDPKDAGVRRRRRLPVRHRSQGQLQRRP